jgi:hypothetical protein
MAFYLLLLTHAVPFKVLSKATGLNWHHILGFWLCFTIALCLSSTIRAKFVSMSSRRGSKTTGHRVTEHWQSGSRQGYIRSMMASDSCMDVSRSDHTHVNATSGLVLDRAGSSEK